MPAYLDGIDYAVLNYNSSHPAMAIWNRIRDKGCGTLDGSVWLRYRRCPGTHKGTEEPSAQSMHRRLYPAIQDRCQPKR